MATNCRFILKNEDFDFIDDELVNETIPCNFPHYNNGEGCTSCPIYRQLFECKTKNEYIELNEEIDKQIQLWWI